MKILYLYDDLMNLYGENGNIKAIKKYCEDKNVHCEIIKKSLNEKLDFKGVDLIYIGSGTEYNQALALEHLLSYKKELWQYINNGGKVLATGNALEMFGKYILKKDGTKVEGLAIIDFYAKELDKRIVGDVDKETDSGRIIGFLNHVNTLVGAEKYGEDILRYKNFYGTYLIGPFLVRNPEFLSNPLCL